MKFAFVFPGQGSQSVGMLQGLAKDFPVVAETFNQASVTLGYDLWELSQQGPAERLDSTEITQPAVLAADIAVYRVWQSLTQATPSVLAGHSLGEYAALVASESLDFNDAIALVAKRGEFMQKAVPAGVGAMAAIIGLADDKLEALCLDQANNEIVSPANFNSIGQTVIAGHKGAVERVVNNAKAAGAKLAKLIPVSVPSHSLLMESAATELTGVLAAVQVHAPKIPVIHNFDVASYSTPDDIRSVLIKQLTQPVRWVETITAMQAEGVEACVECGPGKVLTGLIKRIDRNLPTFSTESVEQINAAVSAVN